MRKEIDSNKQEILKLQSEVGAINARIDKATETLASIVKFSIDFIVMIFNTGLNILYILAALHIGYLLLRAYFRFYF